MMGIGLLEGVILLAVILIFGGWKALPNIAKSAGEFCSTFKKSYKDAEAREATERLEDAEERVCNEE